MNILVWHKHHFLIKEPDPNCNIQLEDIDVNSSILHELTYKSWTIHTTLEFHIPNIILTFTIGPPNTTYSPILYKSINIYLSQIYHELKELWLLHLIFSQCKGNGFNSWHISIIWLIQTKDESSAHLFWINSMKNWWRYNQFIQGISHTHLLQPEVYSWWQMQSRKGHMNLCSHHEYCDNFAVNVGENTTVVGS